MSSEWRRANEPARGRRRKKYCECETVNLRANASLFLASNRGGGGLADRLIAVRLTVAAERREEDVA